MTNQGLKETEYVREHLQHYAERGVFSGLRETSARSNQYTFNFRWLLDSEYQLTWDETNRQFLFKELLPGLSYPGFLDRELRRFTEERASTSLPEHRRIDSDKAILSYNIRLGCGRIRLSLKEGDVPYGLRSALTFVNDLVAWLHLYHIDYLHENFGLPEE